MMPALFQLKTCPCCNGTGLQEHKHWTLFYLEFRGQKRPIIDLENGHVERFFQGLGYLFPPDQKEPCTMCNGSRRVIVPVILAQFIQTKLNREKNPCQTVH